MIKSILLFSLLFGTLSCTTSKKNEKKTPTQNTIKGEIKSLDDSLKFYYQLIKENKIKDIHSLYYINAIQKYLEFYHTYPKDNYSAECLDKVQQLLIQQKIYKAALSYCDTLLKEYPNYKGNAVVLLNAGSIADGILNNKTKLKYYYSKLLEDYANIDNETKDMVQFRLKHIDLTFDEMIELQMQKISKK
jgi:TolA-binding protein